MKMTDPGGAVLLAATSGDLAALDALIVAIQPGVFNLSVRMLGNREDALDATQEILLKVITHLGNFRAESAFTTWVFQIARNHLLTAVTRSKESPEVSLEVIGERLQQGLDFAASVGEMPGVARALLPEEKVAARQVALSCTQNMLMALDREQRLIYVLDAVFALSSEQAAEVLDLTAAAYRQRLSRTRVRLHDFTANTCGRVNRNAPCQCETQLPALQHLRATGRSTSASIVVIHPAEAREAEQQFDALLRMGDAAAVFRAHPEYRASDTLREAIRAVLTAEGYLGQTDPGRHAH